MSQEINLVYRYGCPCLLDAVVEQHDVTLRHPKNVHSDLSPCNMMGLNQSENFYAHHVTWITDETLNFIDVKRVLYSAYAMKHRTVIFKT